MNLFCKELSTEFNSKKDLFKAIKRNEKKIISLKRAQVYKSADKGQLSIKGSYLKLDNAAKSLLGFKEDFVYPVINTTKYMDSHNDVHFDGIWKMTLKEQQGNILYVDNHELKVDSVIAWQKDVKAFTKSIPWALVGKSFEGETEALIYEINKSKIVKDSALKAIEENRPVENSVSMIYVKIILGIDSDDKEFKENKEFYDKRFPLMANKERVNEVGYFWGVTEAKIHKEGSMVLAGSNDATGIITIDSKSLDNAYENDIESQKRAQEEYINQIKNFKYL